MNIVAVLSDLQTSLPQLNPFTATVKMNRCLPRCCIGCLNKVGEECNANKKDTQHINACRTGPFPAFVEDAEDDEDMPDDPKPPNIKPPDEPLEEGDQLWVAGLFPKAVKGFSCGKDVWRSNRTATMFNSFS